MNWPRSGTYMVDPPKRSSTVRAAVVACHGASPCSFGLEPSDGANLA